MGRRECRRSLLALRVSLPGFEVRVFRTQVAGGGLEGGVGVDVRFVTRWFCCVLLR